MMKDKWVCSKCGYTMLEKPSKNQICNLDGCKGRFVKTGGILWRLKNSKLSTSN